MNPDIVVQILVDSDIVRADDISATARVPGLIRTATEHGLFSKKDIVQFAGASLLAGGELSTVPLIRASLAQRSPGEDAFIEGLMLQLGPDYWTHLPVKVKPFDDEHLY